MDKPDTEYAPIPWRHSLIFRVIVLCAVLVFCLLGSVYVITRHYFGEVVQEMETHFGEEFRLLMPSEFSAWRNLTGAENVWRQFDQVVCPVDSIKPVERRRGWSREKLEMYN